MQTIFLANLHLELQRIVRMVKNSQNSNKHVSCANNAFMWLASLRKWLSEES